MRHAIAAALMGAALLASCGDDGSSDGAAKAPAGGTAATSKIDIKDFLYSPDTATVKVGAKVSVTNEDSAPHTLTDKAKPAAFDSDTIKQNQTRTVTFTKAGTFKYYCQFHPTMAGTITVTQ
jgi:plastocyanin